LLRIRVYESTQLSRRTSTAWANAQGRGAEDRQRREEVEARNAADTIAYQVEREIQ
jgi:hypothetical protein